jgi:hypothetical protein
MSRFIEFIITDDREESQGIVNAKHIVALNLSSDKTSLLILMSHGRYEFNFSTKEKCFKYYYAFYACIMSNTKVLLSGTDSINSENMG